MGVPVVGGGEDGGIARRLWIKFRNLSISALYTPFVVCLASGVLDPQSFLHCISQDVYFLKAFAQAYELAEEYADDDEDRDAIHKLRKRVSNKLHNHTHLVAEWGFELPSETTANNATIKYTDFLLATASGKVDGEKFPGKIATPFEKTKLAAYTLAAVGPCLAIYAFISKEIQALPDIDRTNHIYRKWIDNLSSQYFEVAAQQIEDLLEKLTVCLTGEELEVIEKLYHQALRLQVQYFSALPMVQNTIVPFPQPSQPEYSLSIFCDFDMTCTAIDSSALLAEIAIRTATKADLNGSESELLQTPSDDPRTTWDALSTQYTEEYEQCIENITSTEKGEEFNYEGLCGALEQLSDFEKRANSRVIESGVLKGLNLEDIKRAGEHLNLQEGCKAFFQDILNCEHMNTDVHVLSYSWCGDLIRSALGSGDLNIQDVHSNELAFEESVSTGEIIKKVESPTEKFQAFTNTISERCISVEHFTVYIGGSVGDLLCLLNADVGIVVGSSCGLRRVGEQFGVSFVPLFSGLVKKQRELTKCCSSDWKGQSGILYTVSSWAEIHAFILGL